MKTWLKCVAVGFAAVLLLQRPTAAAGTEIKAFMSIGVQSAVEALIPVFEKASGDRIVPTWATAALLNKRLQDGEGADVLISTRAGIDGLVKAGKVAAGSDAEVARSGIGIAVRRGAPKPDISTADALKRTLLASRAISYSNPAAGGASGVHFASVLKRLGIESEMQGKTRFPPDSGFSATLLASGDVDLAIQQISELASIPGTEIVGPLPGDLQLITIFVAGVPTSATHAEAAKAFVQFLGSPQAAAVMKAKGLETPTATR